MVIYVVGFGDTVDTIAQAYQVPVETLILVNQLIYPYELAVGQALLILDENELAEAAVNENANDRDAIEMNKIDRNELPKDIQEKKRAIRVGGYAYPFISRWVLERTLPYLTNLLVFSYGFTYDGELIPPYPDDYDLIVAARDNDTQPILTLTPLGADGKFNNHLISSIVNTPAYQQNLIDNLLQTMQQKGYRGLDIDFEYILASDRDAFTGFVQEVSEVMRRNGYTASIALAPKVSANQEGLLYEGKDYAGLGEAVDYALLMTYEWGYTYGPPMAVAPINQVRRVVEYAVSEISPDKINLGIPNYGYDWPLPYERGVTKAQSIGNIEAVRIAIDNGAEILFDETAQTPYFTYTDIRGIEHVVWFEDVRSIKAKLDLLEEYRLGGCTYWQIMQWFRANWLYLTYRLAIIK